MNSAFFQRYVRMHVYTHRCWNWHHVHSRQVVSCPVQPRARHWSCVFWRDFSGVKRTCWTTGSWRSCLSLEVVSSIPAWSTIIYRFLCGFICVSLCQSIKIKPTNMCINGVQFCTSVVLPVLYWCTLYIMCDRDKEYYYYFSKICDEEYPRYW